LENSSVMSVKDSDTLPALLCGEVQIRGLFFA
jgi:hypothetical protein